MALYDWNRNGKKDVVDDYIEYQIYKECMKPNSGKSSSNSSGIGVILTIIVIFAVLVELFS